MVTTEGQQLFRAGRFHEAAVAFEKQMLSGSGDRLVSAAGLAESLMAVGRYREAIPLFSEVGEAEKRELPGSLGRDTEISICEWLSGDQKRGLALMRSIVAGFRDGSITYANDLMGGLKQGLLLNYMAVSAGAADEKMYSTAFISQMAQSKKAANWPGPVGSFLLGAVTLEKLLQVAVGARDVEQAMDLATTDLMKRRRLTNILFNAAVAKRVAGDEAQCLEYMRSCASLDNPLIEFEWHLARAEVD